MENKSSYWKDLRPVFRDEIKSWIGWGSRRQTMTSVFVMIGGLVLLFISGYEGIFWEEVTLKWIGFAVYGFWIVFISVVSFINSNNILHDKNIAYISDLEGSKRTAEKIHLEEEGNENSTWCIVIRNEENEKFEGYLKVWRVNNEQLFVPIKLGYVQDESKEFSINPDINLFREESTIFGFVFMDRKNKLPIIVAEEAEKWYLEKKRNIVETKLFGYLGDEEIIPKNTKWEVLRSTIGKISVRKIVE